MTRTADDLQTRIIQDPKIMVGKPIVRGTRIPVERVLAHLADTPDLADLFEAFPRLTLDDVRACLESARVNAPLATGSAAGIVRPCRS